MNNKNETITLMPSYFNNDLPVISDGTGRPIACNMVGATSPSVASPMVVSNFSLLLVITKGTIVNL